MAEVKFTSGPWHVEMAEVYAVCDSDGGRIAVMTHLKGPHGMGGRRDGSEVAANTLLTAASPALYEALKGLMELERRGRLMPIGREWDAARAALALAEGKKE